MGTAPYNLDDNILPAMIQDWIEVESAPNWNASFATRKEEAIFTFNHAIAV